MHHMVFTFTTVLHINTGMCEEHTRLSLTALLRVDQYWLSCLISPLSQLYTVGLYRLIKG